MICFAKFVVTKLSAEVCAKVPSLCGFPDGKGFLIVHVDKGLCAVCEKYLHETFLTVTVVSVIVCLWVPCRASIRGVFHYDVCEGGMDVAKSTINECLCAINFKFFPRKCLRAFVMRCLVSFRDT